MTFFSANTHCNAAWCSGVGQVGKKDHNLPSFFFPTSAEKLMFWGDLFVIQTLHEITTWFLKLNL